MRRTHIHIFRPRHNGRVHVHVRMCVHTFIYQMREAEDAMSEATSRVTLLLHSSEDRKRQQERERASEGAAAEQRKKQERERIGKEEKDRVGQEARERGMSKVLEELEEGMGVVQDRVEECAGDIHAKIKREKEEEACRMAQHYLMQERQHAREKDAALAIETLQEEAMRETATKNKDFAKLEGLQQKSEMERVAGERARERDIEELKRSAKNEVDGVREEAVRERFELLRLHSVVQEVRALQHTATHCNTLQHTATHYVLSCNRCAHCTATHCDTLRHTATHCNTLQNTTFCLARGARTATHCNTLQHTTTHYVLSCKGFCLCGCERERRIEKCSVGGVGFVVL